MGGQQACQLSCQLQKGSQKEIQNQTCWWNRQKMWMVPLWCRLILWLLNLGIENRAVTDSISRLIGYRCGSFIRVVKAPARSTCPEFRACQRRIWEAQDPVHPTPSWPIRRGCTMCHLPLVSHLNHALDDIGCESWLSDWTNPPKKGPTCTATHKIPQVCGMVSGWKIPRTSTMEMEEHGRTSTQDVLSQQHLQFTSQTSTALHAEAPLKAACSSLAPAERCHALSPADQRAMIWSPRCPMSLCSLTAPQLFTIFHHGLAVWPFGPYPYLSSKYGVGPWVETPKCDG